MRTFSSRFGVSVSHYGPSNWRLAELERELGRQGVAVVDLRGCAYPEMARAEQVRHARKGDVETLVFVDSHIGTTTAQLEELVSVASQHGVCTTNDPDHPYALECAAVRRDVIEAMVRAEDRIYKNSSAVDTVWAGEKLQAVPLASPWTRAGDPLLPGRYLTDSQAFLWRAKQVGAVVAQHFPEGLQSHRRRIFTRAANLDAPITKEPGSHFALCIPSYGGLDLDQAAAIAQLENVGMVVFSMHDCPWIDQARSWLSERALSTGRGVFFLDHDIQFQPNDVLRLCEQALEKDAVVAGAYCMRRSGKNIIGSFDVPPGPVGFFEKGATLPAYYCGLGFAAVPKSVLQGIDVAPLLSDAINQSVGWGARIRPWYALDCSTGFYAGEDVSFSNRVHDLAVRMLPSSPGFEEQWSLSHSGRPARVFLDSRVRIFHRGTYDYGIEDAGIVVPRIAALDAHLTESRKEAREILVNALDLPVEVKLDMMEFPAA